MAEGKVEFYASCLLQIVFAYVDKLLGGHQGKSKNFQIEFLESQIRFDVICPSIYTLIFVFNIHIYIHMYIYIYI